MQTQDSEPAGLQKLRSLRLNRTSPVPAYLQIAEAVRDIVLADGMPMGTRLPSSSQLCQQFGVSLMTLREAWDVLARDGLIESHRGRGTFVSSPKVEKTLTEMRGFTEEMILRKKVPETRLLTFNCVPPGLAARHLFGLGEDEQVYQIRRLRLADGMPLAIEEVQMPAKAFPELEQQVGSGGSLYAILAERYGLKLARCIDEISATLPTREQRRLLEIRHPTALLMIRRRSYSESDQAIELTETVYRGDVYTATVLAARPPEGIDLRTKVYSARR